jgi:hypothetical protein
VADLAEQGGQEVSGPRKITTLENELLSIIREQNDDVRKEMREALDDVKRAIDANTGALDRLANKAPPKLLVGVLATAVIGVLAILAFAIAVVGQSRGADTEAAGRSVESALSPLPGGTTTTTTTSTPGPSPAP